MTENIRERPSTQAIIDTAQEAARPTELAPTVDQVQAFVIPTESKLVLESAEKFADAPFNVRGTYKVATVESFKAYLERFVDNDTTVWVHPTSGQVRAVVNDHTDGREPRWGDHRVELDLIPTDQWKFWMSNTNKLLSQETFAEHIEDGVEEIVEPDAATMLEIAQSFHMATSATFRSATRLADGQVQVAYDEENTASAGKGGDLTIPTVFTLAVAPFVGEDPYRVQARLRYRAKGGVLAIGYTLERPDDVVRDCLDKIRENLKETFDNVYLGTAPAALR